jgi:hypothetical protein
LPRSYYGVDDRREPITLGATLDAKGAAFLAAPFVLEAGMAGKRLAYQTRKFAALSCA